MSIFSCLAYVESKRGKKAFTSSSFRGDGTQLDAQHVPRLVKMFQCMAVTPDTAELLSSAIGKTAGET